MTYQGKVYSKYYKFKPSMKEVKDDLNEMIKNDESILRNDTLDNCIKTYIASKRNLLSPETVRTYLKYTKTLSDNYKKMEIKNIDNLILQNIVNDYALSHSAKTTRNYFGFISSVLRMFSERNYKVLLPAKPRNMVYVPTKKDVETLLMESSGTKYFIPICLACHGLRIGEIMALTLDDISDCKVRVNKAEVRDENYKKVIKSPKTQASIRVVPVPKEITDKIKKDGVIANCSSNALNTYIRKVQKKYNIQHFSIHKLRHYFATTLHSQNVSRSVIEYCGGWEPNSRVLDRVYTHSVKSEDVIRVFDLDTKFFD